MSTLTLSRLAVSFGARSLFSDLDLTLADGDVVADEMRPAEAPLRI